MTCLNRHLAFKKMPFLDHMDWNLSTIQQIFIKVFIPKRQRLRKIELFKLLDISRDKNLPSGHSILIYIRKKKRSIQYQKKIVRGNGKCLDNVEWIV